MTNYQTKQSFRSLAFGGGTPLKAFLTACVVGTILITINHGDAIIHGDYPHPLKVLLTYTVPFCVTTWGAITGKLQKVIAHVQDFLDSDKILELSFFNFENAITAAYYADENLNLIGRITIDDVVDVILEDADQNFLGMAGIAEDTFAAPARAARGRVLWLSINLMTAFIASMTISLFQATIDQIVYLAILMPIVASMGGVAGTQTLTIMIRGLTLQQINSTNLNWLFKREIAVSIITGLILSVLVGGITYFWFNNIVISLLISIAMVINLICSAIAGILIPIVLRKFNQDPAIAGSVVVTTVTDVIGFFSFLGLAAIFLT